MAYRQYEWIFDNSIETDIVYAGRYGARVRRGHHAGRQHRSR